MRILGIDPGTNILGFAIIETEHNTLQLIDNDIIDLRKIKDPLQKLNHIFNSLDQIILNFSPDETAVESPFFGKNPQSMLKLGRAQGVAIVASLHHNVPVFEYAPTKIKISITGYGSASKEQVAKTLESIFKKKLTIKYLDQTDAIAVAVCHFFNKSKINNQTFSSWKDYAKKHNLL